MNCESVAPPAVDVFAKRVLANDKIEEHKYVEGIYTREPRDAVIVGCANVRAAKAVEVVDGQHETGEDEEHCHPGVARCEKGRQECRRSVRCADVAGVYRERRENPYSRQCRKLWWRDRSLRVLHTCLARGLFAAVIAKLAVSLAPIDIDGGVYERVVSGSVEATIEAGHAAVVTADVPAGAIVKGVPAR